MGHWKHWWKVGWGIGSGLLLGLMACGWWEAMIPRMLPTPSGMAPTPVLTALPPMSQPGGNPETGSKPQGTVPAQGCVPVPPQSPPSTWTFSDAQAALAVLNGGLSPAALNAALQQAGVGGFPKAVYTADWNGDGREDVLLVLVDPQATTRPPTGVLVVGLATPEGGYCEAGRFPTAPPVDGLTAPVVHAVGDLNSDGRAEIVLGMAGCVAEGDCRERVIVLGWRSSREDALGALQMLLAGEAPVVNTPEVEVWGPDEQGRFQIAVTTEGVPGGTGPARPYTLVYGYAPQADRWVLTETRWAPPQVRIHLLHDADRAARAGEDMQALLLYGRVVADRTEIRDEALPGAGDPAQLYAVLAAYARFRALVLHARAGRTAMVEATYAELQRAVDDDPMLKPYLEMASRFREVFLQEGVTAACQAARAYAAEHAQEVLAPLGPEVYGTNNRAYTPEDVCRLP